MTPIVSQRADYRSKAGLHSLLRWNDLRQFLINLNEFEG